MQATTTCLQLGNSSQLQSKTIATTTTRMITTTTMRTANGHEQKCRFLFFLIVNATILVILSTALTRHRALAAAASRTQQVAHTNQNEDAALSRKSEQQQQQLTRGLRRINVTSKLPHERQQSEINSEHKEIENETTSAKLTAAGNNALETNALVYLQRFGYMQAPPTSGAETSNNLISEESFSSAISEFQRFAGLPETGQVDNQTLAMMRTPRCGNTDKPTQTTISKSGQLRSLAAAVAEALKSDQPVPTSSVEQQHLTHAGRRKKRYALQGSKWRRQELTYRISQYPTKFAARRHEVDSQIERAFGIWSQVAPIDFVVKREGRVHIDIRFASGDHGDGDAFDGPGNTLAHAYFPQYGGDAHFDDQEYWTVDSYAGTNIFQVAAHELGHSLGLGHSNVREALMAPFYQKYKPNFKLHLDDVLAIQALYGEKALSGEMPELSLGRRTESSQPAPTSTTLAPSTTPGTTSTGRPTLGGRGATGARAPPVYKGAKRPPPHGQDAENDEESPLGHKPTSSGNDLDGESGNPDLSSNGINGFGGSPQAADEAPAQNPFGADSQAADLCQDSQIDAITRTEDGNSYVFKGDYYWLLTNEGLARGYPRRISLDWEGLPGHLDAALTWADGKTFFFKGNKYWRFRNKRRDLGYPKLISAGFAGVPDDLDAAFVWSGNGRTYFFKGAEYWRFDSKAEPPVSGEYPRSIKVWMGVPAHINAAFKWENNVTYFFKGNQYYRFNDRDFKVEPRGRPPFPRPTPEWWFGCVSSNLAAQRVEPAPRNLVGDQQSPNLMGGPSQSRRQGASRSLHQLHRAQALQQHNGNSASARGASDGQPADWSLLAGLSEEQTRSMGTHISDHDKPSQPTAKPHRGGPDNFSQPEVEQTPLVPMVGASAPPRHYRESQLGESAAEEMTTMANKRRVDLEEGGAFRHQTTGFRLGGPLGAGANGPHYYHTAGAASSASGTSAILQLAQSGFLAHHPATCGDWLALACTLFALLTISLNALTSHDVSRAIR